MNSPNRYNVHEDELKPRSHRFFASAHFEPKLDDAGNTVKPLEFVKVRDNGTARGTMPYTTAGLKEGSPISRQVRRAALRIEAFNQVSNVAPHIPRRMKRKAARAAAAAAMVAGIYPQFTADQPSAESLTQTGA